MIQTEESRAVPRSPRTERSLGISDKIRENHLAKLAVVYVRQSSPRQVLEHRESTELQYKLRDRAVQLGWNAERVLVVDDDLGKSGATAEGRLGFQRLLAEIGLDHVGIVFGIEMSRLARSCKDWYQLIELCAVFGSLLADQDGLYEPRDYNDRLLLGLKGTMSEAELHMLRCRMDQGRRNKASRGELFTTMPGGYVEQSDGEVTFDADQQVQATLRLVLEKFDELGSGRAVLRYLRESNILLPRRRQKDTNPSHLRWHVATAARVYDILHNPIYAGAYAYGRRQMDPRRKKPGRAGTGRVTMPMERWHELQKDRLPAYITWEQYLTNQERLEQNRPGKTTLGAPRQGTALLAGLVVCSCCRRRMFVQYGDKPHRPRYMCSYDHRVLDGSKKRSLAARALDQLVSEQVMHAVEPAVLELSLHVAEDVSRDRKRATALWKQKLERARYQVELARRRYQAVDPDNRLVAAELESQWEQALLSQHEAQEDYDRFQIDQPLSLSAEEHEQIQALAHDLPLLWNAETTPVQIRQEIVRQLVEKIEVTVQDHERLDVTIHWVGGFTSQHEVVRPVGRFEQLENYDGLVNRIAELRDQGLKIREIADQLNNDGYRTPRRVGRFNASHVQFIVRRSGLTRARNDDGKNAEDLKPHEWEVDQLATMLAMSPITMRNWCRNGWANAQRKSLGHRRWIVWADEDEMARLRQLRHCPRKRGQPYPTKLKRPGSSASNDSQLD